MRISRNPVLGATFVVLALFLSACGSGEDGNGSSGGGQKGKVTVGSDAFTESEIVAEMYAQVLENAGYDVSRKMGVKTREIRLPAMENGEIDVAPEYLASLLSVLDPSATPSGDPAEVQAQLDPLLAEKGLQTLAFSDAVDTNAFVTTQEIADTNSLSTVGDLAPVAGDMTLGGPAECPERPFCIPGLKKVYGVSFGDFKPLEYGSTITALEGGEIDVGLLFSTDGQIKDRNLVLLEDDKHLQAADNITPLVRSKVANLSDIEKLLNSVSEALTTEMMTELNARVDIDVEDPADVARDFLTEAGLIG